MAEAGEREGRPRAESAAAQREARERQKERRQAADARRAASNRFSLSPINRKARRADADSIEARSGNQHGDDGNDRDGTDAAKAGSEGMVEEEEEEEEEGEQQQQEEKAASATALVTTPSRRRQARSKAKCSPSDANLALDGHRHWRFTMRPQSLRFDAATHSRSAAELQERQAAGLFARGSTARSSSLVRMEQRLLREDEYAREKRAGISADDLQERGDGGGGLTELLRLLGTDGDGQDRGSDTDSDAPPPPDAQDEILSHNRSDLSPPSPLAHRHEAAKRPRRLAWLQLTVAQVELDDHAHFTLADRERAQLRALVAAYAAHQRRRDWELPLRRVDAFVAHALDPAAPSALTEAAKGLSTSRWALAARQDAERALHSLHSLQQLHVQVLAKWNELRALEASAVGSGGDGGHNATFLSRFALVARKRATPIDLDGMRALLELLLVGDQAREASATAEGAASERDGSTSARLADRLRDALAAGEDGALGTVLELRASAPAGDTRPTSALRAPPRIYVALYVNGRLACRTRAEMWDSFRGGSGSGAAEAGVVTLDETFRLRLPHFPASVAVQVLEARPLLSWGDASLSAHAVPVVVPGSDHVGRSFSSGGLDGQDAQHDGEGRSDVVWVPAASVGATHERYQFSAAADLPRAVWHRSLQDVPALAASARRVQGRVVVSAAWIPSTSAGDADIAFLPPAPTSVAAKTAAAVLNGGSRARGWATPRLVGRSCSSRKEHASARTGCPSGETPAFARGHDFKRHVGPEQLAVDANDPADARVARLQRAMAADRAFSPLLGDVFRLFPDRAAPASTLPLTKRNQLLRLRDRERRLDMSARLSSGQKQQRELSASRSVLLHEPVPLLDAEILANEAYLRLLRPELRAFDRQLMRERAGAADADYWSVRGRHERQRLALLEFLDRVEDEARRFALDPSSTSMASASAIAESSERPLSLASIIQEQPLPLFPGTLELPALGALFARRRKLRPRSTVTRPVAAAAGAAHWPRHCELYVQVLRASNVPLRMKLRRAGGSPVEPLTPRRLRRQKGAARRLTVAGDEGGGPDAVETPRDATRARFDFESRVFVEVDFQGRTRRTTCCLVSVSASGANGAAAEWMETLALPFHAPEDDWDPAALASVRDCVRLRLYDRVLRSEASEDAALGKSGGLGKGELASRVGKRALHEEHCLLGTLEIPFATLLHAQGIVDAPLRCVTPVEHLGYANVRQGERAGGGAFHSVFASSMASSAAGDNQRLHGRDTEADDGGDGDAGAEEDGDDTTRVVGRSERDATYLHVMMTLNPLLPPPPAPSTASANNASASTGTASRSPATVLRDATLWASSLGLPSSIVASFLRLGPALVTQLLGEQQPPPGLATIPEVVHFVRCLPLVDAWRRAMKTDWDVDSDDREREMVSNGALMDEDGARQRAGRVWASSQDCLDLCAGDSHAHAVLLHNYLAWLGAQQPRDSGTARKPSLFLVFGRAATDGEDAVLVLWKAPDSRRHGGVLWDAATGVGCHVDSEHSPLRQVFLAVSSDNVFANVQCLQPGDRRRRGQFDWDISGSPKRWKPLFGPAGAMPLACGALLPCLQPRDLRYAETPPEYVASVERELHEALKLAMRRWRSAFSTTVFNLSASLKLRAHLELLEKQHALGIDLASVANSSDLKTKKKLGRVSSQAKASTDFLLELQRTHDVAGVPVHAGFTDIPSVVRAVKDRGVHETARPGVEFLLAVYVCGYPSSVLSVWVYVASMAARG